MARLLLLCLAALGMGCGSTTVTPVPTTGISADWVTLTTEHGWLRLSFPPWLNARHNGDGGLYAEAGADAGGESRIEVMVSEPDTNLTEIRPGQAVEAWMREMLDEAGQQGPFLTRVVLPAGPAIRYETIYRPGAADARRMLAVAVERPAGVGLLIVSASAHAWEAHQGEIELLLQSWWLQ